MLDLLCKTFAKILGLVKDLGASNQFSNHIRVPPIFFFAKKDVSIQKRLENTAKNVMINLNKPLERRNNEFMTTINKLRKILFF
jgi:hypothetical protein